MDTCPCVQLPASFAQREDMRQLAGVPPLAPQGTPLQRTDPTSAWYDAATVFSLLSSVNDFLKG